MRSWKAWERETQTVEYQAATGNQIIVLPLGSIFPS
jgi:creatinine amidohydrolase/Fe(II)-dependent formamide hydrolase-like protein